MYHFIAEHKNNSLVNEKEIYEIEKKYEISFPNTLKEFYLVYNGERIELCKFVISNFEYEISEILPLKYGDCTVEYVIENDREDAIIPCNMIPIANNRGGDYYYWDTESGHIYLYYCDDIENPIYICESVESLFQLMEHSC